MKVVSENFKARAENPFGARYITKIVVEGNVLTENIEDFKYSSMCNPDGDFSFGNTCAASVTFSITQPSVKLSGKEIEVYQGLDIEGELEEILLGKFMVLKLTENKGTSSYECYDCMISKMEMPYFSDLSGTVTDIQILNEICKQVDISLANEDTLIAHELSFTPVGYTRREVIGYMAQLQGKNALINAEGNLELIWYTDTGFVVDDEKIYLDGTDAINDETDYVLEYLKCSVTSSNSSETLELTSGGGDIGISFENPFMTQEILNEVFAHIGGFSFRPVEVEFLGDFRLEVGDIVTVSTNGVSYVVPIMQLEHSSDGGVVTMIQSVAESDEENQIDTKGPVAKQMERYYAELVLLNRALVNKLSAEEADIRYIKVDEIDAFSAKVEDAVIENLDADLAKIEDLQATNARVENLETGVAEISTLMFGAAGGESLQTEFANAVIAQLGEAQIKSAMIESVSAEKITAGDIITNNVCVRSEDGRLILSDETIQISDNNMQVRVQIGRDANNDYSINIWDSSGNLMFSQGGITENAIKHAIIRDDMISEHANISASKLDIDSLFTEINESSNTIKATKVYFDDEEQTLEVAFQSMAITVDELSSTQADQGTQISAIQGQISSKIWEEDITIAFDTVKGDVSVLSTKYSTLNQDVSELSSTIGSHTTQIDCLDTRIDSAESSITQLSNEISLKVAENGVIAAINLSSETALIHASKISLVGAVTFASLDASTQTLINSSSTTASKALEIANAANTAIANWCYNNNTTYIDGANIYTGTITSKQINVEDLFAQDITATGSITGVTIVSTDGSSSRTITIENGILRAGSASGPYLSVANGGLRLCCSGNEANGGIRSISNAGLEFYLAEGKAFYFKDGDNYVMTLNKNASYAGFMEIIYPLMTSDIYAADISCSSVHVVNTIANRVLISNSSGKMVSSAITSTELGYLDGVTSNIQTQLNNKAASSHTHTYLEALTTAQLELKAATPYLDFHYGSSSADYTSRIIAQGSGVLDILGGTYGLRINTSSGVMCPTAAGGISLGSTNLPFYILRTQNSVVVTSVAEAKENIRPFTSALEEIDKTDVFNYNLKACLEREGKDIDHTGFVIGEGYNISELLISHDGNSVDLYNCVGLTLGGVKELLAMVREQACKIVELENRLHALYFSE